MVFFFFFFTRAYELLKKKMKRGKLFLLDPPQPQPTIERFGYVIGRQGIVNVTVYANPRPRFLWRVNNEIINEGRPDESNRLETSTAVDLVNCSINSYDLNFIFKVLLLTIDCLSRNIRYLYTSRMIDQIQLAFS